MPFYDYKCGECGHVFEAFHAVDEGIDACEKCGGRVKRLFHPVGIIFKGSGFYATDYKSGKTGYAQPGGNGNGAKEHETETASSSAGSSAKPKEEKKKDDTAAKPDGGA